MQDRRRDATTSAGAARDHVTGAGAAAGVADALRPQPAAASRVPDLADALPNAFAYAAQPVRRWGSERRAPRRRPRSPALGRRPPLRKKWNHGQRLSILNTIERVPRSQPRNPDTLTICDALDPLLKPCH